MTDVSQTPFFSAPDFRKQITMECAKRSKQYIVTNALTFFKSEDGAEYLVSVTSNGTLTIWILSDFPKDSDGFKKRKTRDKVESVFQIQISKQPLLDVINLPKSRLACCGIGGVFILDWKYILSNKGEISMTNHITHLNCNLDGKVHVTNLSEGSGMLFAAASDRIYSWDIEDFELVHTFYDKSLPEHSIHLARMYKSADNECHILTGGSDGKIRFWDVNDRSIVHEIDLAASMNQENESQELFFPRIRCIQIENDGSWAVLGGSCSKSSVRDGFVALLNIRTKTICSIHRTREVIHSVSHHSKGIITVGNEGAVSFWDSFLGRNRMERFYISLRSCNCIAVEPITQTVAIAGIGDKLSCLTSYGFQSNTLEYP